MHRNHALNMPSGLSIVAALFKNEWGICTMLKFQLFRFKVYPSKQRDFFREELTPSEILRRVLQSLPAADLRKGQTWHIGNFEPVDATGVYFRLGKTSKATLEVFDESMGSFNDQEFETAPYTHVLADVELEVGAIASKSRLAPTTFGIARQLMRLLNQSEVASKLEVRFEIDDIKDPEDFLSQLRNAYSISKFRVDYTLPNPFDADEDFVKPFQKFLQSSKGTKGTVEVKGEDLESETLEKVSRSTAATGDDADAWLKRSLKARPKKISLKGNPVTFTKATVENKTQRRGVLDLARSFYNKVRHGGKGVAKNDK